MAARKAETDDGERAHHAERKHDVASHGKDDDGGYHRQRDERHTEAGGVHDAHVGLFVHKEYEESQREGEYRLMLSTLERKSDLKMS